MRRQGWIRAIITLLAALILIPTLGSSDVLSANPQAQAFSATIQPLGGVVQRQTQGGGWEDVTKVTLLKSGDTLRTGAEGTAEVSTVTGIKITVFPTTEIQLQDLSMNSGNAGGQNFSLDQTVGTIYVTVEQELKAQDNVEFFTPSGRMIVHGTRFYIFVSASGKTTVIGEEDIVTVEDFAKKRFDNGPDDITFIDLGDFAEAVTTCNRAFLQSTAKGRILKGSELSTDFKALVKFLKEFLKTDTTDDRVRFIAELIGLPTTSTAEEILVALDKIDKPLNIDGLVRRIRAYFAATLAKLSGKPAESAPQPDAAACGNGLCETGRGESALSCSADCQPNGQAIRACIRAVRDLFHPRGGGGGVSTQEPTNVPINTPVPSGVG
jgi:hypothetical protein